MAIVFRSNSVFENAFLWRMINRFLPYGVLLPSFRVHPENYTHRRGHVRVDTVDLVDYCTMS